MIILWTQLEMAEYLDVTSDFLLRVKKGERRLGKKNVIKLKEFYRGKLLDIKGVIDGDK